MNKDRKLGIGVAALCIILFLVVVSIGSANKQGLDDTQEDDTMTEHTQVYETEMDGTESDRTESDEVLDEEQIDYSYYAIADVNRYVNVRQEPNTDSAILGKIFDGSVAQIIETVGEGDDQWFKMISGNVEGYIKAEFFIHGEEAAAVLDQYVSKYVRVNVKQLNVREGQTTSSRRIGFLCAGEKLKLLEDCGEWLCVQYSDGVKGYVAAEYVTIVEEYVCAKTPEEELADQIFLADLKYRAEILNPTIQEDTTVTVKPPATNPPANTPSNPSTPPATNKELRKAIIDYAMQYLGGKYVLGGQSLATGTDCSGFTMYILAEFGYSISRTPQGQYTGAGRAISYAEAQPGDIICYSSNGGKSCTHVAFYIGDGKIIHAANPRMGIKISSATHTDIFAVKNVID